MAISLSLSREELSFAILTESNAVVSTYLFEFVLNAIKARHPIDWKKKVGSCFGAGVGGHVRQRLEKNLPMADIYTVCRIISCRINDVAKFYGGKLLHPREKERLCFQVGGVETARHWAFHGDQHVSVGEVRSSIALLRSLIKTLCSGCEEKTALVDDLSTLINCAEILASSCPQKEYILRPASVINALMFSSLVELERSFKLFFCEEEKDAPGFSKWNDFSALMKHVREATRGRLKMAALKQLQDLTGGIQKPGYVAMCKNISAVRNALAHNASLTLSRVRGALTDVQNLLRLFGLCCRETVLATNRLELFCGKGSGTGEKCSCVLKEQSENVLTKKVCRQRILRPQGHHFVGRELEIIAIHSVLAKEGSQGIKAVLIFGQAGVGKSYLATNAIYGLTERYFRQTWLNCSDAHEFQLDCQQANSNIAANIGSATEDHLKEGDHLAESNIEHLFVFDNVCSECMHLVYSVMLESCSAAVLTTRSTAVKQHLQRLLPSLHIIDLRPFSPAESKTLMEKKTKTADVEGVMWTLAQKSVSHVLENLPLCVNIYSSFITSVIKKNCQTRQTGLPNSLTLRQWRGIEEDFGDRLHIRCLSGILQCAETFLQDYPLVVLLLAKIGLANSGRVPWEILHKTDETRQGLLHAHLINLPRAEKKVMLGLLGVADWIFSGTSEDMLNSCRNTLEELGLISWEDSTATVCIHMLTLWGIQEILERRYLFLENFFAYYQLRKKKRWTMMASEIICVELLLQILSSSVNVLQSAVNAIGEQCSQEVAFAVFEFLARFVEKDTPLVLQKILPGRQLGALRTSLVLALFGFSKTYGINIVAEDSITWAEVYQQFPLNKGELVRVRVPALVYKAYLMYRKGMISEAKSVFDTLLKEAIGFYGMYSYAKEFLHYSKAALLEEEIDPLARRSCLTWASGVCPSIMRDLTHKTICSAIFSTKLAGCYNRMADVADRIRLSVWLFTLRKAHAQKTNQVDSRLQETILLLIILCQQRQCLIRKTINEVSATRSLPSTKTLLNISFLIEEAANEAVLWNVLEKPGRVLRVLLKTYHIVDKLFFKVDHTTANRQRVTEELYCNVNELVERLCLSFWKGGGLSILPSLFCIVQHTSENRVTQDFSNTPHVKNHKMLNQWNGTAENRLHEGQTVISFFNELQTFLDKMDSQRTLTRLVVILTQLLHGTNNRVIQSKVFCHLTINFMAALFAILGERRCFNAFHQLVFLSDCSTGSLGLWRDVLQNAVVQIKAKWKQYAQVTAYELFMKYKKDFSSGNALDTRKSALRCWRELVHSLQEIGGQDETYKIDVCMIKIIIYMMLELARVLQQIYAGVRKLCTAEWFLKFRIHVAEEAGFFLLAAKYSFEYFEFLKQSGRLPEALEKLRILNNDLVEQLGDDYLEWLSGALNIASLKKELEEGTRE